MGWETHKAGSVGASSANVASIGSIFGKPTWNMGLEERKKKGDGL